MKLKELEKALERKQDDLKEKEFLLKSFQEEVDRKNQQIENFKALIEEMNLKLLKQSEYIETLEKANKDTLIQFQIESSKSKREHDKLIQSMKFQKSQQQDLLSEEKSNLMKFENQNKIQSEQVQKQILLLKNQCEREKRMVDEKVRELTMLQSSSLTEKDLRRENVDLKHLNAELNQIIKEERMLNGQQRQQFTEQIGILKQKISNIEFGCANQIIFALRNLRDDLDMKVSKNESILRENNVDEETVEQIIKDINERVNQVVKQRENLQKAINIIQGEKQQLMVQQQQQQQLSASVNYQHNNRVTSTLSRLNGSVSNKNLFSLSQNYQVPLYYQQQQQLASQQNVIPGNISRMLNPLDQSYPQIIPSQSPLKSKQSLVNTRSTQQLLPNQNVVGSQINPFQTVYSQEQEYQQQHQQSQELQNLYEYLQTELVAVRQKKDQLQQKVQQQQNQIRELEQRTQILDIFQKKENVDTYQQLISNVREVLLFFKQEYLLDDIVSQPLKQKSNKKQIKGEDNSILVVDDSIIIFQENSQKLICDLESLLPLIGKCLCMLLLEKDKLSEQLRENEKNQQVMIQQRKEELDLVVQREIQDKGVIKQLENQYKMELEYLKREKDNVLVKTKEFSKNLQILQKDNLSKKDTINMLKNELKLIKEESLLIEEKIRKEIIERLEREYEQRMSKIKEEHYYKGRKEGADEMTLENQKLREIIDSLRIETSTKGKRLIELQFELEELQRQKRKSSSEVEELYQKLSREREGQKELQQRLDGLLQEVSHLKNLSRQMHQQQF